MGMDVIASSIGSQSGYLAVRHTVRDVGDSRGVYRTMILQGVNADLEDLLLVFTAASIVEKRYHRNGKCRPGFRVNAVL